MMYLPSRSSRGAHRGTVCTFRRPLQTRRLLSLRHLRLPRWLIRRQQFAILGQLHSIVSITLTPVADHVLIHAADLLSAGDHFPGPVFFSIFRIRAGRRAYRLPLHASNSWLSWAVKTSPDAKRVSTPTLELNHIFSGYLGML